jgi:hypothetical protein
MRSAAVLSLFLSVSIPAIGQQAPTNSGGPAAPSRAMSAARRTGRITLDGRLAEAAWNAAAPSGDFIESYPTLGTPAPDRTEVRVL